MKLDGKKFDIALAKACLTINELAEKADVGPDTIFKVKGGSREALPQTVGKLARALCVDPSDLIEKEG